MLFRSSPIDIQLVRSVLSAGDIEYSSSAMQYLSRFGQWCDAPLIIDSLNRPEYSFKYVSLLLKGSNERYSDAANALYALGAERLVEMLSMSMPDRLLKQVLLLIPDSRFKRLPDTVIVSLMRAESDIVRKVASLKFLRAFSRRRAQQLLVQYTSADNFFYNVVHWLDFGISVPRERVMREIGRAHV